MVAWSGEVVKTIERSRRIPGIFRKPNKRDLMNGCEKNKWGRRRGQGWFLGFWLVLLDTWWYQSPWSGDQLRRGGSGQGEVRVGLGHAVLEGPVSYPSGDGQWAVGSLVFRAGARSELGRLESHQHLVGNWTHRTGWGLPRRRLVCLEEDRPEVPCVGSGPWNRSRWDVMPSCWIDRLLVRSQPLNSTALEHFLTFVVCCGALFSEWYHYW